MLFRCSLFAVIIVFLFSCKKEIFSTDENAFLSTSITSGDSLKFDTVFTQTTTPVKIFKVFNHNRENILIDKIELAGGNNSPYKININGVTSADFLDITLTSGDSLYVFVNLTVPASQAIDAFDVTDSLGLFFNNKKKNIVFNATAQNAVHLDTTTYTSSANWKNNLPIIVKGNITIAKNAVLNIEPGTKIYFQNGTGITVNGSLNAAGTAAEKILLRGFRSDNDYKYLPGTWNGIAFGKEATNNKLIHTTIENAKTAVADTMREITNVNSDNHIEITAATIQHCTNGAQFQNTHISIANTLIANCENALNVTGGGTYKMNYCTIVGYGNRYVQRSAPLLQLSDKNNKSNQSMKLSFDLMNSIVHGSLADELFFDISGDDDVLSVKNSIYKSVNLTNVTVTASLQNADPKFLKTDDRTMQYDFRVAEESPAKGFGVPVPAFSYDISGVSRSTKAPTVGCYE